MTIKTEYFKTRSDGVMLNRTYSDGGVMIEREGSLYSEAIDPADLGRVYIETDQPIVADTDEATEADYQEALRNMGVDV